MHARTGDMILFSGSEWTSKMISLLERRNYSHSAILYVIANEYESQRCALPCGVYLAESDLTPHGDWSTGQRDFSGVQLVRDAEARLREYEGIVHWIPLVETRETNLVRNLLLKPYLAEQCGHCPYNKSLQTWLMSGLRSHITPLCNTRDLKGHYCISFVCEALQTMQVMSHTFNPFNAHFNTLTESWRRNPLMVTGNVFSESTFEIKYNQ